jgi:hypothetical protein
MQVSLMSESLPNQDGRTFFIERERQVVLDVVRLARKVPTFPVERWFELAELSAARSRCSRRISWLTLFVRAYGLAGRDVPQLRQAYSSFPIPRLYQSPNSVISVAVTRQADGVERLFFGRLRSPEQKSLLEIQQELDELVAGDPRRAFKLQYQGELLPGPLRSFLWWWRMNVSMSKRAKRVGTGSISVLAGLGVHNRLHPCILTSSLSYGPLDESGRSWVTLQCDHRVIDGVPAAHALNLMHGLLCGQILTELRAVDSP